MAAPGAGRRGRILVVDDQRANVEMLAELLRSRGYLVDGVYDAEAALRKVTEMQPDLVVSDIRMPGMDGYELTQRLRSDPATALLPVVLVTSLEDRDGHTSASRASRPARTISSPSRCATRSCSRACARCCA